MTQSALAKLLESLSQSLVEVRIMMEEVKLRYSLAREL